LASPHFGTVADLSRDKKVLKVVITKNGWGSQFNGKI
jgi:hypothetical protein